MGTAASLLQTSKGSGGKEKRGDEPPVPLAELTSVAPGPEHTAKDLSLLVFLHPHSSPVRWGCYHLHVINAESET